MSDAALRAIGVVKQYGPRRANDEASLEVKAGTIHALVGENGAGKSTLCKILFGLVHPDDGEIFIHGERLRLRGPRDAMARGVGMVHQHFMLVATLTVAQNVVLGDEPSHGPLLDDEAARRMVADTSARFGLHVDPDALVGELPVGVQQRVEILKALGRGAKTLILDEPTAVLTPLEVDALFDVLRRLRAEGRTVLIVTHKLREVLSLCDDVTVMRGGRTVGQRAVRGSTLEELSALMVGRAVDLERKARTSAVGAARLEVEGLKVRGQDGRLRVDGVSLRVAAGEVVGIAGVEGNGQTELVHALAGVAQAEAGTVRLDGREVSREGVRVRRALGLCHVPEDRLAEGLVAPMRVDENTILGDHHGPPFSRRGLLQPVAIARHSLELIDRFDVRPIDRSLPIAALSGGNQQKVLVGRELTARPKVLLLAQPTRGVDIGAIELIHTALLRARDEGLAILLISAELSELIALSDVIHVMFRGRIVHTAAAGKASPTELGPYMLGGAPP